MRKPKVLTRWKGNTRVESLPLPPPELRELVGITDADRFDEQPVVALSGLKPGDYQFVVDFGCGCGRLARQLARGANRPRRYIGVDLHRDMIRWCKENLAPRLEGFTFLHHDVFNPSFNPDSNVRSAPLPVDEGKATLVVAWSVFTHLLESQVEWYLSEIRRILAPGGKVVSTWFLFDKTGFPMMQDFQNALYINDSDPTNAVIFDKRWLLSVMDRHGLVITSAIPPEIRGFQWVLELAQARPGDQSVALPPDEAPIGRMPPPIGRPQGEAVVR